MGSMERRVIFLKATVTNALIGRNASSTAIVTKMDNTNIDVLMFCLGGNYVGALRYNSSTSSVSKKLDITVTQS